MEKKCKNPDCGKIFQARFNGQMFCSKKCGGHYNYKFVKECHERITKNAKMSYDSRKNTPEFRKHRREFMRKYLSDPIKRDKFNASMRIANKKSQERHREFWNKNGLCVHCGGTRDRLPFRTCRRCANIGKLFISRKRREWDRKGLCLKCGSIKTDKKFRWCWNCRLNLRSYRSKKKHEM